MSDAGRYDVSGLPEAQFEPGSDEQVLRNLLGIRSRSDMDHTEALALERATDDVIRSYDERHRFMAEDLCRIHGNWLGAIYEWAGAYRRVNVSKGDVPFAAAAQIPRLMAEFERGQLAHYTPCRFPNNEEIVKALAEVHTELVLIHPFREGNGRIARLLATLMALQAGLPLLNFAVIADKKKPAYFAAVRAGLDRDYRPMGVIFAEIIERTLEAS